VLRAESRTQHHLAGLADYVLALKANQGSLREDVELFVAEQKAAGFNDTEISRDQTIEQETRFYITSLVLLANLLGPIIRSHWAIENSLHWVLDMIFRDDECRVRTDHAPANFATIRHMAQNLIRKAPGKASLRLKRKAAWPSGYGECRSVGGGKRSADPAGGPVCRDGV
jgi:predicted transposase YbfD/YdcC